MTGHFSLRDVDFNAPGHSAAGERVTPSCRSYIVPRITSHRVRNSRLVRRTGSRRSDRSSHRENNAALSTYVEFPCHKVAGKRLHLENSTVSMAESARARVGMMEPALRLIKFSRLLTLGQSGSQAGPSSSPFLPTRRRHPWRISSLFTPPPPA